MKVNEFGKFLVIDNTSFHDVDELIKENLKNRNIAITRTPQCFASYKQSKNFSYFDYNLHENIKEILVTVNYILIQVSFIPLIHKSLYKALNMDLKKHFRRS